VYATAGFRGSSTRGRRTTVAAIATCGDSGVESGGDGAGSIVRDP
jgi:hypothetical protein